MRKLILVFLVLFPALVFGQFKNYTVKAVTDLSTDGTFTYQAYDVAFPLGILDKGNGGTGIDGTGKTFYHSENSNLRTVDWSAKNLFIDSLVSSNSYQSGFAGTGYRFNQNGNGELSNLSVRNELTVNTFTNNKINISNGDLIVSDNAIIDWIASSSDIVFYFSGSQPFQVDDILTCHGNVNGSVKYYTIKVTSVGVSSTYKDENGEYRPFINYNTKTGTGDIEVGDILVRTNSSDIDRKGYLSLNSSSPNSPFYDVVYDDTIKARFGNLEGITDPDLGNLTGYGLYGENVYLKGKMKLAAGSSISFADVEGGQEAIDAIKIEGRNLILNSSLNVTSGSQFYDLSVDLLDLGGQYMTLSYDYEYDNVTTSTLGRRFGLEAPIETTEGQWWGFSSWVYLPPNSSDLSGSGRSQRVITVPLNINKSKTSIGAYIQVESGSVKLSNFKLEKGAKATDWTPAPEDEIIAISTEITNTTVTAPFIQGLNCDFASGSIGGFSADANYLWTGTQQTSDTYSTNGLTLASSGAIRTKEFYTGLDGSAHFKGSMTGGLFRTSESDSGQRIEMKSITNDLRFYDNDNNLVVLISDDIYGGYGGIKINKGYIAVRDPTTIDQGTLISEYNVTADKIFCRNIHLGRTSQNSGFIGGGGRIISGWSTVSSSPELLVMQSNSYWCLETSGAAYYVQLPLTSLVEDGTEITIGTNGREINIYSSYGRFLSWGDSSNKVNETYSVSAQIQSTTWLKFGTSWKLKHSQNN